MLPLPTSRVSASLTFSFTGLDYLGPVYVKNKGESETSKMWICLFTCLCTRAIHLELIEDLTAEQFLMCFQRFIARRGRPTSIYCDNASQFKLVSVAVEKLWQSVINDESIINHCSHENIKWKFIPERAL